jgi:type IV secretion system protein VirB8
MIFKKIDPEIQAYLDANAGFDNYVLLNEVSQKITWRRSFYAALAIIGLCVIAFIQLFPLKQEKLKVIRVDTSTGIVDIVPDAEISLEGDEKILIAREILGHYQHARERFFYALAETDYEYVGAMNNAKLNAEWSAYWNESNPQSPLVRFKDGTTINVHVKNITFLEPESGDKDMAQIRFYTEETKGGSGAPVITHWISTIKFAFGEQSTDKKIRALNPLGFKVLAYQKEPEVVAETAAQPSNNRGNNESR